MSHKIKNIAIVTCCSDDWGGSEALWARMAPILLRQNCSITVYKEKINFSHPEIIKAKSIGIKLVELSPGPATPINKLLKKIKKKLSGFRQGPIYFNSSFVREFTRKCMVQKPDLVLINQAINFDGLGYAYECYKLKVPYAIITHKAVDFFWPTETERPYMITAWQHATKCFFVSSHNLKLTEEQFGFRFPDAEIIWNPIKVKREPLPFPPHEEGYQLACIGRFFIIDKGQDILLRILSEEPWRSRPVTVSFVGDGPDENALKELATLLHIQKVRFLSYQNSIEELWKTHHALILPSRSEGMPLVTLEAMAVGRPVIVTTAGGHSEIISNAVNGFIADATIKDLSSAMEEAWEKRDKWDITGKNAYRYISEKVPLYPENIFADSILKMLSQQ